MASLIMLWTDIRILLVDTTRVWWRLLPKIVAIYLLGWLGYELAFQLAVIAGDWTAWASLAIFASAFVFKLVSIVLILRLAGNALGVRSLIPDDEYEDDGRDSSITRLLAITLLPFLGIYAAFGEVTEAANQLTIMSWFRNGVLGDRSILTQLRLTGDDIPLSRVLIVLGVIVGLYIVRRALDLLHEKTDWRPLGILVSFVEALFVLVALFAGGDIIAKIRFWIMDRQFVGWLDSIVDGLAVLLARLGLDLPDVLLRIGDFIAETAWPVITSGLAEPIFWLAIASLVYGSSIISVAELWRKGKPLASRVRVAQRAIERTEARSRPRSDRGTRVASEVREAFFSDIDDKYLPTLQSLRLILRAGLTFLGAYVLVYALQSIVRSLFEFAVGNTIGGQPIDFWVTWGGLRDLIVSIPFEPWRLCLLAAALQRCLAIFRMRAEVAGSVHPATGAPLTAQAAAEHRIGEKVAVR